MVAFTLIGEQVALQIDPKTPLLWALREQLKSSGTKFGCGKGLCGACTVHVNGDAMRSCITPASSLNGMAITTIEGLSESSSHPLQQAWIAENVPQCGYCQFGQIMSAAALLMKTPTLMMKKLIALCLAICAAAALIRVFGAPFIEPRRMRYPLSRIKMYAQTPRGKWRHELK